MNEKQVIIDVREPFEYESGHVEGALNVPLSTLALDDSVLDGVDKKTKLITYCKTGGRSNESIKLLRQRGFTNITNGINAKQVEKIHLRG